jgi:tetratricopeptide (TPR) repeat protein
LVRQLQNSLGAALERLGEREGGTTTLEEAVFAYREALKEATRERAPVQWASIQSNLGFALYRLGEREAGTAQLEEAVFAYREALKEATRERAPLLWGVVLNNLGRALRASVIRDIAPARCIPRLIGVGVWIVTLLKRELGGYRASHRALWLRLERRRNNRLKNPVS